MKQESPAPERSTYACPSCKGAFAVMLTPPDERTKLADLLPYATCPGCGARDPVSVARRRRELWRARLGVAAFYGVPGVLAVFAPWVAYVPAAVVVLITVLAVALARRRSWIGIARHVAMVAAFVAPIVLWPRFGFVAPLVCSVWVLVPVADTAGPFERAASLLRFESTPYRG